MAIRVLALVLLSSLAAMAQLPRGFYPWWDQPIAKDLNLSEVQSRQIREAIREYRGKLIEQRAAVEKAEAELQDLFGDDKVDAKRASQAIDDLAIAREHLTRTFSEFALRLRMVVTPEQWRMIVSRRQEYRQQRREQKGAPK